MKKIFFWVTLAAVSITISCNNDDGEDVPDPVISTEDITFGSNEVTIQAAFFREQGEYDVINDDFSDGEESNFESATHYSAVFQLSDGTYDSLTQGFNDEEIIIRAGLFSAGGSPFQKGTFIFYNEVELEGQPSVALEQSYFTDLVVTYQGEESRATAGTVAIAGSSPNWTISFDITLGVSTTLEGAYSGGMVQITD